MEADLAAALWANNCTAVAELHDDTLGVNWEPVLRCPPELLGLHLHAIHENTAALTMRTHAEADAFAAEWGFLRPPARHFDSIAAVSAFAAEVERTGAWDGAPIERLIVRLRTAVAVHAPAPPYPPDTPFFLKISLDGPYRMYHEWRVATEELQRMQAPRAEELKLPHKRPDPRTTQYAHWVAGQLQRDPAAFARLRQTEGIIGLRERFLAETTKSVAAGGALSEEHAQWLYGELQRDPAAFVACCRAEGVEGLHKHFMARVSKKKLIQMPYDPRSGHVRLAEEIYRDPAAFADSVQREGLLALWERFIIGISPEQKDGQHAMAPGTATSKKTVILIVGFEPDGSEVPAALAHIFRFAYVPPHRDPFPSRVVDLLHTHDIVVASRRNHRRRHRSVMRGAIATAHGRVRLIALYWPLDPGRVYQGEPAEPLAMEEADAVVTMDSSEPREAAVRRAVDACVWLLGLPPPPAAAVELAARASDRVILARRLKLAGLLAPCVESAEATLPPWVAEALQQPTRALVTATRGKVRADGTALWSFDFRGTVLADRDAMYWVPCRTLDDAEGWLLHIRFKLGHLLWDADAHVVLVTVDGIEIAQESARAEAGAEVVAAVGQNPRRALYLPVGPQNRNAGEAEQRLVVKWMERGDSEEVRSIALGGLVTTGQRSARGGNRMGSGSARL